MKSIAHFSVTGNSERAASVKIIIFQESEKTFSFATGTFLSFRLEDFFSTIKTRVRFIALFWDVLALV